MFRTQEAVQVDGTGQENAGAAKSSSCQKYAGVAQLARASAFQAEGRGFESRFPLQFLNVFVECPHSSGGRALPW